MSEERRIAVVADAHIGGPGGPGRQLFEQLEALPQQGCGDLLLLGDLFHVWVGSTKYEDEDIHTFVGLAKKVRAQGVRIHYVEGNRDFFLDDSPYAEAFDEYGTRLELTTAQHRILAVHGDLINEDDRAYLFWRRVSKSALSCFCMRHLPGWLARRMVYRAERGIARTNEAHRHKIPEQAIREFGAEEARAGYDLILMGHFHEPATFAVEGCEVRLVDAWYNSRSIEWIG